jgi:peroxiredoxin
MPFLFQATPVEIPRKELPKAALCLVCSQQGEGEEKPAAGARYKGTIYYFCNRGELKKFLKDPEPLIPAPLPRPAPAFSLKTPTGDTVTLESMKGKVVLVDFWATWCKPCIASMPDMQKLHAKLGETGVSVVGIAIDEEGATKVAPFLNRSKTKFTYPMLLDPAGDTWKAWGVKMIPFVALVKDGQIVRQWSGTAAPAEIEKAVKAALGTPP